MHAGDSLEHITRGVPPVRMERAPALGAGWMEALDRWTEWLPGGEVLQAGRHRLLRCAVAVGGETREVAVKEFCVKALGRVRLEPRKTGKARRAWETGLALAEAGVGTPPPLALIEQTAGARGAATDRLLTLFIPGLISLREALNAIYRERPRGADLMALLQAVATACRRLHDAGWMHYDLGNQNILLPAGKPPETAGLLFVDLNRARRASPTPRRAARDLSRLCLPSDFRRILHEMYFDGPVPPAFRRWERFHRACFAWHTLTRPWRHPLRERRRPQTPAYPPPRDIWIWDEASAQALSAWTERDRQRLHRKTDALRLLAAGIRQAPAIGSAFRELSRAAFREPVDLSGRVGVAVQMRPETEDRERALLAPLGRLPLLLRACHHETEADWDRCAAAVRGLAEEGHPVTLALVQDRRAVREPARWRDFVERMLQACGDSLQAVELGHAVNRSKWGFWSLEEYRRWCEAVVGLPERYPRLDWIGPAAIDFEFHRALAFLEARPAGLRFAALSHHLYVDRRGAPENRQGRFSTLEKTVLARALARAAPGCGDRLVITEFNWPLKGTGVHSPVCSPYLYPGQEVATNVSEKEAACYLVRYLLLTLCSGMAERAFWWRLAARGFGLVDDSPPGPWRPRAGFEALRDFLGHLGSAVFVRRPPAPPGVQAWEFADGDRRHWLLYAHPHPLAYAPPVRFRELLALPGGVQAPGGGPLRLTGTPLLLLDTED